MPARPRIPKESLQNKIHPRSQNSITIAGTRPSDGEITMPYWQFHHIFISRPIMGGMLDFYNNLFLKNY